MRFFFLIVFSILLKTYEIMKLIEMKKYETISNETMLR